MKERNMQNEGTELKVLSNIHVSPDQSYCGVMSQMLKLKILYVEIIFHNPKQIDKRGK